MAIRFNCNNCGKTMVIQDSMAGKRMKCPGCKAKIVVPGEEYRYESTYDSDEDSGAAPEREPLPSSEPALEAPEGLSRPELPSEAGQEEEQVLEIVEDQGEAKCPYCMEPIKPQARKCRHCGEFLDEGFKRRRAARGLRGRRRANLEAQAVTSQGSRALTYAIVGIFICGIVLEPVALIMGLQALSAAKKSSYPVSTGSATAAVVIASIILGLWITLIIAGILGGAF